MIGNQPVENNTPQLLCEDLHIATIQIVLQLVVQGIINPAIERDHLSVL